VGKTSIEWTDATWNPIVGCSEVSPGCAHCYAARLAATRLNQVPAYAGLSTYRSHDVGWTGEVRFLADRLDEPLHWRKPRKIFVCDMSDLFHEKNHDSWICDVFDIIRRCPQHTFQILTKRAARLRNFMDSPRFHCAHVWLGVSVENQHFADERIPLLLETPAAVRFVSAEPLLGPVDFREVKVSPQYLLKEKWIGGGGLDWVICGGESGPHARPMHPDWARSLRDQCQAANVPFFFKQSGEWFPNGQDRNTGELPFPRRFEVRQTIGEHAFVKLGKSLSGRLLDGREWNQFPGYTELPCTPKPK